MLSSYFEKIIATDTSEKQLSLAIPKEKIIYQLSKAEQTPFTDNSFDLISIAQAYHWFQFNNFEKEAKRVAKPGAVIAAWGYNIPACYDTIINGLTSISILLLPALTGMLKENTLMKTTKPFPLILMNCPQKNFQFR